ncbi:MAG: AI-2E family transporter [Hyphomicrobiales bacterium]|nr:AI-2E family transporter [Hyphomicrobiales bacterium]
MTDTPDLSGEAGPTAGTENGLTSSYLAGAFFVSALLVIAVVALVYGSGILVPLAVALLFWFFLNALARFFERLWQRRFGRLRPLSLTLAFLTMVAATLVVADAVVSNIAQISTRTDDFQRSLSILVDRIAGLTGVSNDEVVNTALGYLNIDRLLSAIVTGMTGFASNIGVVFVYVIFMLVEQRYFGIKLKAVVKDSDRRARLQAILDRVARDIQSYLWTMFLVSLATAVLSYAVMYFVGLDSAVFWAFLIFVLNFIPTIGSILGTAIPALYALLQFGDIKPFLVLLVAIGLVQFVIGNIVQPRMAAQTLNLSQFVVILSLFVWGAIWGIGGLFLAVPLTAVMMIIFSNVPQTRPVAILMSEEGRAEAETPAAAPDAGSVSGKG